MILRRAYHLCQREPADRCRLLETGAFGSELSLGWFWIARIHTRLGNWYRSCWQELGRQCPFVVCADQSRQFSLPPLFAFRQRVGLEKEEARMTVVQSPLVLNDVDRRIWADELDAFVPQRVFDIHTHCYRWDFNTDPAKDASAEAQLLGETFREAGRANWMCATPPCCRGGRYIGLPSAIPSRLGATSRRPIATRRSRCADPDSGALMLVHPSMSPCYLEESDPHARLSRS